MPRSIRDDDQPGLWLLPETPAGPTANPPIRQHAASVAKTKRRNPTRPVDSSPTIDPETLWTIDDLASYLGIPKHTIYGWRTTNYGPPAIKVGKHLRWRPEGVVAWAKKQELSDESGPRCLAEDPERGAVPTTGMNQPAMGWSTPARIWRTAHRVD